MPNSSTFSCIYYIAVGERQRLTNHSKLCLNNMNVISGATETTDNIDSILARADLNFESSRLRVECEPLQKQQKPSTTFG